MWSKVYALIRQCFVSIWSAMKSIEFAGTNVAEFSIALIVIGVFLSIFLSFVNVNNIRSSYGTAERRNRNNGKRNK